ncbi:unnamed protein product [Polarella glacialis]|uniref:Alpha/beta hydrolase fold-3 domain-containing protein n=1 Tax=Polarella glacialis TaxID=89957 RepID=A0A813FL40_POLGL|nr:unnamed protein product [Polarella glacialis]
MATPDLRNDAVHERKLSTSSMPPAACATAQQSPSTVSMWSIRAVPAQADSRMMGPANIGQSMWNTVTLPLRAVGSVAKVPLRTALQGCKRPSWNTQFESCINLLRSVAKNAPRHLPSLRRMTDVAIPSLLLPRGVLRATETVTDGTQSVQVEWIWPAALTPQLSAHWPSPFSTKVTADFKSSLEFSGMLCRGPVVLYLHGGAFCLCSPGTHRFLLAHLALELNAPICCPIYRRPPDVLHSVALADCGTGYGSLLQRGIDPGQICFMGDSAGGGLVLSLMCSLRDCGQPLPATAVLISPWVDLSEFEAAMPTSSLVVNSYYDYLPLDLVQSFAHWTVGGGDPRDPSISPLFADLSELPPTLVMGGGCEILCDQIKALGDLMHKSHPGSRTVIYEDMVHAFPIFLFCHQTAFRSLKDISAHVVVHCTADVKAVSPSPSSKEPAVLY